MCSTGEHYRLRYGSQHQTNHHFDIGQIGHGKKYSNTLLGMDWGGERGRPRGGTGVLIWRKCHSDG